jgi:hypothetical protein
VVGRRRTDSDLVDVHPHRLREPGPHLVATTCDARVFADEDAVGVHELEARAPDLSIGVPEEQQRRNAAERVVFGGKEAPDVPEGRGPEERVDERVGDDVAVGVPGQATVLAEADPREDERDAVGKGVSIDAEPDPQTRQPSSSW